MSIYDFTAALGFLDNDAEITPEELYEEVIATMEALQKLQNKHNRKVIHSILLTMMDCADFLGRIEPTC